MGKFVYAVYMGKGAGTCSERQPVLLGEESTAVDTNDNGWGWSGLANIRFIGKSKGSFAPSDPKNFAVERIYEYEHNSGIMISVARTHPYPRAVLRHIDRLLNACPIATPETVKRIYFSGISYPMFGAGADPVAAQIAYPLPFGSLAVQRSQRSFDHEMGHIVGCASKNKLTNGGPLNNTQWKKARQNDASHVATLSKAELNSLQKRKKLSGSSTSLLPTRYWVTQYANTSKTISNQAEDWADSWSLYLLDLRKGYLYNSKTFAQPPRFVDIFPHRAAILDQQFAKIVTADREPVIAS